MLLNSLFGSLLRLIDVVILSDFCSCFFQLFLEYLVSVLEIVRFDLNIDEAVCSFHGPCFFFFQFCFLILVVPDNVGNQFNQSFSFLFCV